ncbi:LysR substrate-binding domain-containing protein [Levilactobacillus brevis]|nr:LysR substrate-binding domain-containing protein [Levilactobacillus brevis]
MRPFDVVTLSPGSGVYERISERYQQAGFTPNIRFSTPHIETLLAMIAHTDRVTFLLPSQLPPL